jgi:hypothetical protein
VRKHLLPEPFCSFEVDQYEFIFLNAFEAGDSKRFDLSEEQIAGLS